MDGCFVPAGHLERLVGRAAPAVAFALLMFSPCGAAPPAPLPADKDAADKLLAVAGPGFRIRETDHFTIAYDTSYDLVRPLVGRLEGSYDAIWRFCEWGKLPVKQPASRLQVILFDRQEDYARYCAGAGVTAESLAGFYSPASNLAVFGNTLTRPEIREVTRLIEETRLRVEQLRSNRANSRARRRRRDLLQRQLTSLVSQRDAIVERFNRFVIQHEAAHQMFFNIGLHVRGAANPLWLVEGMACQFEIPQAHSARGTGRVNHVRLADLRDAFSISPDVKRISDGEYREAFESNRLLPLVDLIADRKLFSAPDANAAFRYAQAWGLVFYLNRIHRGPFAEYLRLLTTRKPGDNFGRQREIRDFQAIFGPLNDAFQRAWADYMVRLRFDRRLAGR